jgi:hypothetical protein
MKEYCWYHIPSGKSGTIKFEEEYSGHLLEMIAKWNRQGAKVWQYWIKQ